MAEIQSDNENAMLMVQLRNQFYQKKFYSLLSIFILMLVMAGILVGLLVYLIKHPTRPVYFVADEVGRLMYEVPLSQPVMSVEEVTAWAIEAVETAYTYNYINFRAQLQESEKYFTRYGWQEYMKGLTASNNLLALTQRKMIFLAKVVQPPKLITQGILGGAYAYKFEMPVLISYLSPPYDNVLGKSRFDNALIVDVIVQRQKILSSYKGLGIVQLLASVPQQTPQRTVTQAS
ncbi:MAG: DotI/IcmL/TraM family protein [Gammaproteobacteria bacterium]|nr:DotI/IcmL/TraM family protein [Gammaproteobacteria bacterium]